MEISDYRVLYVLTADVFAGFLVGYLSCYIKNKLKEKQHV